MKNKNIVGVIIVLLVVVIGWTFLGGDSKQEVSTSDPVDIVLDFYEPWLQALHSTSTDPYELKLDESLILSKELRARLSDTRGHSEDEADPVLCQTTIPITISSRPLSTLEDKVEILVVARDKGLDGQAIITLLGLNDGWYIDDITCSLGEFAPVREFSFEKEGHLLKSVPLPYDSNFWHLVFEENGELGHVAPLSFNAESICILADGKESVCDSDQFLEATKATVYGEMSEVGVTVKKLQF